MFNPQYTEAQINQQLKELSPKFPVEVYWDGDEANVDAEGVAVFTVLVEGDETPFIVHDIGYAFDLIEDRGGYYSLLAGGRSFSEIAKAVLYCVEAAIEDGTITVEREDD